MGSGKHPSQRMAEELLALRRHAYPKGSQEHIRYLAALGFNELRAKGDAAAQCADS